MLIEAVRRGGKRAESEAVEDPGRVRMCWGALKERVGLVRSREVVRLEGGWRVRGKAKGQLPPHDEPAVRRRKRVASKHNKKIGNRKERNEDRNISETSSF
jgi:hypothetical protein